MADGRRAVDAHCHLADAEFDGDIDDVVKGAKEAGVGAALVVAEETREFDKILSLARRFPDFILPCLGVHPVQGNPHRGEQRSVTLKDLSDAVPLIEKYHEKLAAIGEIGLDFSPRFCKLENSKDIQRQVLIKQIELAKKYDLPINVHSRSAGRPTIALLKEQEARRVLLHAFDGKPSVALAGVQEGYYYSIPPSIVRSEQKKKLVEQLPIDNVLLETDSPALGPDKQVRNVPANIMVAAEFVAQTKKIGLEEVLKITTTNALKLFPKLVQVLR